ncbi:hypothetical protein ILUMI_11498 [Ignelater luminosus]|uniref:Uncharacterized protein n=1 Tax=Ignelater luminosus TaxID=2038154 RepID=A0A8K0GD69_IGNLU|nr:hypothetical protein ILUMI_11498 [Ignelater luminosus]
MFQVVGLARRKEKVNELAKKLEGKSGKLYSIETDISKEEDILSAFQWVKDNLGSIHILINNAGIGKNLKFTDTDAETCRKILDTNLWGLSNATREALKNMQENNIDGHIINISSTLGYKVSAPNLNMYPATKFALRGLQETLKVELASMGSKVKITTVSPGIVDTDIWEVGGFISTKESEEHLKQQPKLQAQDVADTVIFALSTPPHVQIAEVIVQPVGEI